MTENDKLEKMEEDRHFSVKKSYHPPVMQVHGKLNRLTQGASGGGGDGSSGMQPDSNKAPTHLM